MKILKVKLLNDNGEKLAGRLTLPSQKEADHFALFAHCFTCSKNFNAARNIANTLSSHGFGVLSIDFTGLGESGGKFENTNFSTNVADLLKASAFLQRNYKPPSFIIGHSLGGAAAIYAAAKIRSIKAIVTIGTPSDVSHVKHLLQDGLEAIEREGEATVILDGRPFKIKQQFLEDLKRFRLQDTLSVLRKAILIMHSPQDATVEIENAERLYTAAHHPKSFVSLNGAHHLLAGPRDDARYAANVIAAWVARYLPRR